MDETLRLCELRGKRGVLYFQPESFPPFCTIETRRFRDGHADLTALGAEGAGCLPRQPTAWSMCRGTSLEAPRGSAVALAEVSASGKSNELSGLQHNFLVGAALRPALVRHAEGAEVRTATSTNAKIGRPVARAALNRSRAVSDDDFHFEMARHWHIRAAPHDGEDEKMATRRNVSDPLGFSSFNSQ
jgi:hypothetical protein